MKTRSHFLLLSIGIILSPMVVAADSGLNDARVARYYDIRKVPTPSGVDPQIGGLDSTPDGRLVAAFHHGEVEFFNPRKNEWKIFAEGLHEPLGVLVEPDGSVLTMQRAELTRLRDTDGDGIADSYDTLWDGFGMTGNYHEFAFGPVRAPDGKLFVSLNLASNGAPIFRDIRGKWIDIGLPREEFYNDPWPGVTANAAGRMYSRVSLRGWVVQIDPKTGEATPFASGFRSPDGLGFDTAGNLFVDDNQGDWRGTNEVHVVKRDGFYGHPASLVWRKDWDGSDPLNVSIEKLNSLRTVPAIELPYITYSTSPTQILLIPKTASWGPFGGQLLVGEMNAPRLMRLLPEEVDGVWQGACAMFIESQALKGGLHRCAFIGDTLFVGRTHLSWVGAEGISSVRPLALLPFDPVAMQVRERGFHFEFTKPLAESAKQPERWPLRRYYYKYHLLYGSPEIDKTDTVPIRITLSDDHRMVDVELPEMKPGLIYDFDLSNLQSSEGEAPLSARIAYTLNRVPQNH